MSFNKLHRATGVAALAVLTTAGALALAAPASAVAPQTRYVATNGSDGTDPVNDCTVSTKPCQTIQHAVDVANSGDTISVGAGSYAQNVNIGISLTLTGAGASSTTVTGSGAPEPTVFIEPPEQSTTTPSVTVRGLSLSHNSEAPGLVAFGSDVTISDATLSDNADAGALAVVSTLHVVNSSLTNNNGGGSDEIELGAGSGVAAIAGEATIEQSTLADNDAAGVMVENPEFLGGLARTISADTPAAPDSSANLVASTVSGNQDGGVVNLGGQVAVDTSTVAGNVAGGVAILAGTATILRSTVAGTTPLPDAPDADQGGIVYESTLTADFVPSATERAAMGKSLATLTAGRSAAIKRASRRLTATEPAPGVSVVGSVVAQQKGVPDCFGAVDDGGYNLSSDVKNSCGFSSAKHSITKTAAKLGALAHNGGPTSTEKPLKGSPAIDAIPSGKAGCATGAVDQRGVARPQPTGGRCDIGAVELAAKPIVIHPDSLPHGTVGEAYHATLTATGGAYPTYVWSLAPGSSLPDGLSLSSNGHITGTPTKAGSYSVTVSVNDPVLKRFTIVIDAATGTNGSGTEPLSATGAPVESMTAVAAGSILAGFLLMIGAGLVGSRKGRHRATEA